MVRYEKGTDVYTYTYNGDGQRLSKTVNGVTTEFTWDGMDMILESAGSVASIYVYGNGINYRKTGNTVYTYTTNAHGDVVNYAQGTTVVKEYCYDAFGNELDEYDSRESENPLRYCGEYYDAETGLYYLRNRYYDPQTGRFITEDPIRDGNNWYVYCNGNPVMFFDPTGLENETDAERYGEESAVFRALKTLGDAWREFPNKRHDIETLANFIRDKADTIGSLEIDISIRDFQNNGIMGIKMPTNLNIVEQVLVVTEIFSAKHMNDAREKADKKTYELFGQDGSGDDGANAFKHAYWNAMATKKMGSAMTQIFADAHEYGWVEENVRKPGTMYMDLHNNYYGRITAETYGNKSDNEIAQIILNLLRQGVLWTIE